MFRIILFTSNKVPRSIQYLYIAFSMGVKWPVWVKSGINWNNPTWATWTNTTGQVWAKNVTQVPILIYHHYSYINYITFDLCTLSKCYISGIYISLITTYIIKFQSCAIIFWTRNIVQGIVLVYFLLWSLKYSFYNHLKCLTSEIE